MKRVSERGWREKERKKEKISIDGDSTKQRCLIGVGPHQVDRGPPNRVLEDDMGPWRHREVRSSASGTGMRLRRADQANNGGGMLICLRALLFTRPETRASYSPFPLSHPFSLFLSPSFVRHPCILLVNVSLPLSLASYLFPVWKYRDDSANRVARRPQVDGAKIRDNCFHHVQPRVDAQCWMCPTRPLTYRSAKARIGSQCII